MNIKVVTQPSVEPVTLEDCYAHLRLTITASPPAHADDDWLTVAIRAAREYCEAATGRAFVEQTLLLTTKEFPLCRYIRLERAPVISISSVKYYDADNVEQTVTASDYFLTDDFVPRAAFVDDFSVPSLYYRDDAVRVTFLAGYEASPPSAANVPRAIKQAMLLLIGHWYVNREAVGNVGPSVELAVDSLLSSYRIL